MNTTRLFFLILLIANGVFFAYHYLLNETDEAAVQIELLQISPGRIKTVNTESSATGMPARGSASAPVPVKAPAPATTPTPSMAAALAVCVEWGSFAGADVARADAAIAALGLAETAVQRRVSDGDGYWVHMPPMKTKTEVDRKVSELKALGVADFYVVQDAGQWRNAVSLGLFKSEEAANTQLAVLRERGVRSAIITRRENFLKQVVFFVRDSGGTTLTRVTELRRDFPASEVKTGACPPAAPEKS